MVRKKVVIQNPTGLHLRPAGVLCKTAMQFKSSMKFTGCLMVQLGISSL